MKDLICKFLGKNGSIPIQENRRHSCLRYSRHRFILIKTILRAGWGVCKVFEPLAELRQDTARCGGEKEDDGNMLQVKLLDLRAGIG